MKRAVLFAGCMMLLCGCGLDKETTEPVSADVLVSTVEERSEEAKAPIQMHSVEVSTVEDEETQEPSDDEGADTNPSDSEESPEVVDVDTEHSQGRSEESGDDIILVEWYENYAYGYTSHGVYLTRNGNVYAFDLSEQKDGVQSENIVEILMEQQTVDMAPVSTVSEATVTRIIADGDQITGKETFSSESVMFDAGSNSVYYYDWDSGDTILIQSNGDWDLIPNDDYMLDMVDAWIDAFGG